MLRPLRQLLNGAAPDKWYGLGRIAANALARTIFAVVLARIGGTDAFAVFVGLVAIEVVGLTLVTAWYVTPIGNVCPRLPPGERDALCASAWARTRRGCVAAGAGLFAVTPLAVVLTPVGAATWIAFAASTAAWLASSAAAAVLAARFRSARALAAQLGAFAATGVVFAAGTLLGAEPVALFFAGHALGHAAATVAMGRAIGGTGPAADPALTAELRRHGTVGIGGSVANSVCTRVQPFVLAVVGGAPAVAIFGAANTLVGPLRVLSGALGDVLRPRLALHQGPSGDPARARRALGRAVVAVAAATGALLVAVVAAGGPLAELAFGPGFAALGAVLPWAAAFVGVASAVHVVVVAMQTRSLGGAACATRTRIAVAALSLLAVGPACAADGARGAFVAMTLGEAAFLVVGVRFLVRRDRAAPLALREVAGT